MGLFFVAVAQKYLAQTAEPSVAVNWQVWAVAIAGLYATFAFYWLLQLWLARHLQGLGLLIFGKPGAASSFYFWLLAPGVILHELSHWLMAKLLFVPTGEMALFRPSRNRTKGSNKVVLGYVEVYKTDPIRQSFIGLAPLLTGILALVVLSTLILPRGAFSNGSELGTTLLNLPGDLWASFTSPINFLWLYLVFTVSNGMLPSAADRRPWLFGFILPGAILLTLEIVGFLPRLSEDFQDRILGFLGKLTWVFAFAALINLMLALVVMLLEYSLSRLRRRKVVYSRK
jgi:hypothetical protein